MPPKSKSAKPEDSTVAAVVVPATTPAVALVPAVTSGTPAVPEDSLDISGDFTAVMANMTGLRHQLSAVMGEVRALQKRSDREMKAALKSSHKRKNKNSNRAPSGFVKPTLISDQLADFLSKPHGSLIARTEVTREINAYIRANKLQDTTNGRKINPDAKLKKLLSVKTEDELTYFNLQRFMSQHFKKTVPAVVPAAV
jgi:chromatin remodeling complex protein RSC6